MVRQKALVSCLGWLLIGGIAIVTEAVKEPGLVTYDETPEYIVPQEAPTRRTQEVPLVNREVPGGSGLVLSKVAYPGDLSAFLTDLSSQAKTSRARVRKTESSRSKRTTGNREQMPVDYITRRQDNVAPSDPVLTLKQVLPAYASPENKNNRFTDTEAELEFEGAGFFRKDQKKTETNSADKKSEASTTIPVYKEQSTANSGQSPRFAIVEGSTKSAQGSASYNQQTIPTGSSNVPTLDIVQQIPIGQVYQHQHPQLQHLQHQPHQVQQQFQQVQQQSQLQVQQQQIHQQPLPQGSRLRPNYAAVQTVQQQTHVPSTSSGGNHYGMPIPATYTFYPTLGQKGYFMSQESSGHFIRAPPNGAQVYNPTVGGNNFMVRRSKRETKSEKKNETNKPNKFVKLALYRHLLKEKPNAKKPTPSHLKKLVSKDQKLQPEASEYYSAYDSYPFFGSNNRGGSPSRFGEYNEGRGRGRGQGHGHNHGNGHGRNQGIYQTSESGGSHRGLGSGNFEIIRGGIYTHNRGGSSGHNLHNGASSETAAYGGHDYDYEGDEDSGEQVLGFQGFNNFGSLHNALASKKHLTAIAAPERRSDGQDLGSQFFATNVDLLAID